MQPLPLVNTAFPLQPSSFGWPLTQYGTCAVATFPSVDVCRSHKVLIVVVTCAARENKLLWFIFLKPLHYYSHTRSFINQKLRQRVLNQKT